VRHEDGDLALVLDDGVGDLLGREDEAAGGVEDRVSSVSYRRGGSWSADRSDVAPSFGLRAARRL
jgi:hypothetical protein